MIGRGRPNGSRTSRRPAAPTLICIDSLLTIGATNPDPNDLLAHPKGWHLELARTSRS